MRSAAHDTGERATLGRAAWDVAPPARCSRLVGVRMAGFGARDLAAVGHRVVPHPAVTLALDFGDDSPVAIDAAGRQHRGSLVAGLGLGFGGSVWVRGADVSLVQVRLSPVVAHPVLGVSPVDLSSAVVTLDDLWGPEASRIRERLGELSCWEDRFALIDALLVRRRDAGRAADPEVTWVWDRIVASVGQVRVDSLARHVGWSRKRLWSRFQSQVGLPPKRAATLVRFDHAAHRLAARDDAARVAAEAGYVDQSHLHRDIVAFSGATPATVGSEPWLAVDDTAWASQQIARR